MTRAGFEKSVVEDDGITVWKGDPNDDAAHQQIFNWLNDAVEGVYLEPGKSVTNRIKGNLGEFIAHKIGRTFVFSNCELSDTANADEPLSDISRPGIDILWFHLGCSETDDWLALQEVKTTNDDSLRLADQLVEDYEKLFGTNIRFTLQTRLTAFKNRLENYGKTDIYERISKLAGSSAELVPAIRAIPTLVHVPSESAVVKMATVRETLVAKGWATGRIECWSIPLSDLDQRLNRLARGEP